MEILIATEPDIQPSLVLDEGQIGESEAALDAVNRVLSHQEMRVPFSDEEMIAFAGIACALEAGTCKVDAVGSPVLIPPRESGLVLEAMRLFVNMPADEQADLSPSEKDNRDVATQELSAITYVFLEPGVQPEEVLGQPLIDLEPPENPYNGGYEWLHSRDADKSFADPQLLSVLDSAQVVALDDSLDHLKRKTVDTSLASIPNGYDWFYPPADPDRAETGSGALLLSTPMEQAMEGEIAREEAAAAAPVSSEVSTGAYELPANVEYPSSTLVARS